MKHSYALVTGASSGLGVDFADILAEKGYNLILVARRLPQLENLKVELAHRHGVKVEVISMDLSHPDAPQHLYDITRDRGLEVEVLVNNAGYGLYGLFQDIDWQREANMLQLDMVSLTHLTKLYSRDMIARNRGSILLVSSIGAYQATPTYATYAAGKSYVLHFGEALNYELRNTDVNVSVLSPGVTATEFLQVSGQKTTLYQRLAMMKSRPVAKIGIDAMFRNKPSVIPGFLNKLTAFFVRFMPRRLSAFVSYQVMKTDQQKKVGNNQAASARS